MEHLQLVIVGSGPAAYTAAIYAGRAFLHPLVFEGFMSGTPGGQLMSTTDVENFPGFPEGVMGPDLMEKMRKQALHCGAKIQSEDVILIEKQQHRFFVKTSKKCVTADVVIVATGASAKRLDIPGARDGELWQRGVTACAVCDGAMPIFRNKDLYVVGGGDTAIEEALFLTKYARKVFVVHRRDSLRASQVMARRLLSHKKVEVLWEQELVAVEGDSLVTGVILQNTKTKEINKRNAAGVFFAIGHTPNTAFLNNLCELDDAGYIVVHSHTKTSVNGLYAAGDVADHTYRQAITAAGSGCMSAMDAERYIQYLSDVKHV